jgi:putative tricarboxylic transport membrane protein
MRFHESLLGLLLLALAAAFFGYTFTFPDLPGQRFGPSLFPRLIAVGLAISGLILVFRGRGSGAPWLAFDPSFKDTRRLVSFLALPLAVVAYIFLAPWLGFLPTAAGLVVVLCWWFGARAWVALVAGVGTALAMQWFFGSLMRVPLPRGLFMQLIAGG